MANRLHDTICILKDLPCIVKNGHTFALVVLKNFIVQAISKFHYTQPGIPTSLYRTSQIGDQKILTPCILEVIY